jgi:hypothetical protein
MTGLVSSLRAERCSNARERETSPRATDRDCGRGRFVPRFGTPVLVLPRLAVLGLVHSHLGTVLGSVHRATMGVSDLANPHGA